MLGCTSACICSVTWSACMHVHLRGMQVAEGVLGFLPACLQCALLGLHASHCSGPTSWSVGCYAAPWGAQQQTMSGRLAAYMQCHSTARCQA